MKTIILGDIGWRSQYHVGDEAMTEAALEHLRAHGLTDITLIAGEPDVAEAIYGVPAVARIGYHRPWGRMKLEQTRARLKRALLKPGDATPQMATMIEAIRGSDAAIIAGGGNLNSSHAYHLFERWSFAHIAEHFGVPLYVVSQTVGPDLEGQDRSLVIDILTYAKFFGARETSTYHLLKELDPGSNNVVHTMDDAVLIRPNPSDFLDKHGIELGPRYVVASFEEPSGALETRDQTYHEIIANLLDEFVIQSGVTVALVPHVGSLEPDVIKSDEELNQRITGAAKSANIISVPMTNATTVAEITSSALASITTRYHQAVFSAAMGVPSIAIASDEYDVARMCGAYENLGLDGHVLPARTLADVSLSELITDLLRADAHTPDSFLEETSAAREQYQHGIWHYIAQSIYGHEMPRPASLQPAQLKTPVWGSLAKAALSASRALWKARAEQERSERDLQHITKARDEAIFCLRQEISQTVALLEAEKDARRISEELARTAVDVTEGLRLKVSALESALNASQNRRAARIANSIARVARKLRPVGPNPDGNRTENVEND